MRIPTIFWISIALAAVILIGKSAITFNHAATDPSERSQAPSPNISLENRQTFAYNEFRHKPASQNAAQEGLYSTDLPENEQTALASAQKLLEAKNSEEYKKMRQQWQGNEKEMARWIFFDAEAKILEGKTHEAAEILESSRFKGQEENDRLLRLAGLYIVENPQRALAYLSEAVQNEPENPDLHLFKASLNEALNQNRLAAIAYVSSIKFDANNPHRREMLADFYLRTKQYPQALAILQDTMDSPSLDSIWLKAAFWTRVAFPFKIQGKEQEIPGGRLKNLAAHILSLPEGIYWNEQAFSQIPGNQNFLSQQQETFWLQLLSSLKTGKEKKALTFLLENPFQYDSWAPDLEKGLITLLNFRLYQNEGGNRSLSFLLPQDGNVETPAQLLQLLAGLSETPPEQLASAIPYQLHDLLLNQEAFVVPFLAMGWNEAALQLHTMKQIPEHYPQWVALSLAKAISQNRDSKTALIFAQEQPPSSPLSLTLAELALEAGEERLAFETLKEIYTKNDESGKRAALILGQFLAEHHNPADAKKALAAQPSLAEEPAAKEILARIAIQQGDLNSAHALYLQIEKESSEAKSFLAQKAFADKDWTKARILTESLLKNHPGNPGLEENLMKIKAEEQSARRSGI